MHTATAGCDQAIDCPTTAISVSTGGVLLLCDVSTLCCMLIEYIYQPELPLLADPQGQSTLRWHIPIQITVLLIMFYCSNKRDLNAVVNQQGTVTVAAISTHSSCPRPTISTLSRDYVRTFILSPAVCGGDHLHARRRRLPCGCAGLVTSLDQLH